MTRLRSSEAELFRVSPGSFSAKAATISHSSHHPLFAGAFVLMAGMMSLVLAMVGLGAFLVEVVLHGSILRADNGANHWLAHHRTPFETDVSWLGSHLAETGTVIVIVTAAAIILCARRRFVAALFLLIAIAVEAATYLATVLVIDRPRPHVVRLDNLGPGASYPSGHTAAAVVTYVGIAMIVRNYSRNHFARRAVLVLAVLAPSAVALARMYRGMHHPIDVISGALMGFACLGIGLVVSRIVGEAHEGEHRMDEPVAGYLAPLVHERSRL